MAANPTPSPIRPLLSKIPLFAQLADAQIGALSRLFVMSRVKAGDRILMQGEPVTNFIVVHTGEMALLRTAPDGRERIVGALRPGLHFGLAEMITGEGSAVAIRAEKPSTLGVMSQEAFQRVVLADPKLCYALMRTMARSIFRLVRQLDYATFESVGQRLARCLTALGNSSGLPTDRGVQILPAPTHQDLAKLVGASRETITRALGRLRDAGILELGYRRITILDLEALADRIAGDES